jgi:hypothetical protein
VSSHTHLPEPLRINAAPLVQEIFESILTTEMAMATKIPPSRKDHFMNDQHVPLGAGLDGVEAVDMTGFGFDDIISAKQFENGKWNRECKVTVEYNMVIAFDRA